MNYSNHISENSHLLKSSTNSYKNYSISLINSNTSKVPSPLMGNGETNKGLNYNNFRSQCLMSEFNGKIIYPPPHLRQKVPFTKNGFIHNDKELSLRNLHVSSKDSASLSFIAVPYNIEQSSSFFQESFEWLVVKFFTSDSSIQISRLDSQQRCSQYSAFVECVLAPNDISSFFIRNSFPDALTPVKDHFQVGNIITISSNSYLLIDYFSEVPSLDSQHNANTLQNIPHFCENNFSCQDFVPRPGLCTSSMIHNEATKDSYGFKEKSSKFSDTFRKDFPSYRNASDNTTDGLVCFYGILFRIDKTRRYSTAVQVLGFPNDNTFLINSFDDLGHNEGSLCHLKLTSKPLFSRQKLFKSSDNVPTDCNSKSLRTPEFIKVAELCIGKVIFWGDNQLWLYDCDSETRQYYEDRYQIHQPKSITSTSSEYDSPVELNNKDRDLRHDSAYDTSLNSSETFFQEVLLDIINKHFEDPEEAFSFLDTNQDGFIDASEILILLKRFKFFFEERCVIQWIKTRTKDIRGRISLNVWKKMIEDLTIQINTNQSGVSPKGDKIKDDSEYLSSNVDFRGVNNVLKLLEREISTHFMTWQSMFQLIFKMPRIGSKNTQKKTELPDINEPAINATQLIYGCEEILHARLTPSERHELIIIFFDTHFGKSQPVDQVRSVESSYCSNTLFLTKSEFKVKFESIFISS